MWLSTCGSVLLCYALLTVTYGQEVSDQIFKLDLDPELQVTENRKRDTKITLPPLNDQSGAKLPLELSTTVNMASLGTVAMKTSIDVVGQSSASLLKDLDTLFGALTPVDGFYTNSDVTEIIYPFIMQLVNPTPRVIIQVQQLLVVQRLECCKSGEETCCGIIAQMMTQALTDKYNQLKETMDNKEKQANSHRVFWRQLDSLIDMPPIAIDSEAEEWQPNSQSKSKLIDDKGDSVKITKRNRDGSTFKKVIHPQIPNHMLDEGNRRKVDEAALEDGDASHVFTLDDVVGPKVPVWSMRHMQE